MNIETLIEAMKKRPKMFVEEEKIEYIFYFLFGYCSSNLDDDLDKYFCMWFGKWLIRWIKEHIDEQYVPKTALWHHDIKMIAGDKQDEAKFFYDLCDEFFEDYRKRRGYFAQNKF
ncbi:MAG: hypothetical protein J1E62_04540 [Lachnospiraceae bacterium]|nr:hypothetical protein [Lachnospiraceae bacterium]